MFDGYLRAPDYRRGSNKYRTLTTGVYDWRKELEAIYITESAGGTESYVDRSIDFILADLCRIANSAGVMIPRDTPKGTYFPVPVEPWDKLVKDVTNITGSGGRTGNTVLVEGKGTRTLPNWKLQPPKDIGKDYKKLLNHVIIKGRGTLKTQTLGEIPLLGTLQLTAFTGGITKNQTCSVVLVLSQIQFNMRIGTYGRWYVA